jgi:hypothetical protein
LAGKVIKVTCYGEIVLGEEAAFSLSIDGQTADQLSTMGLYLWLESEDGEALNAPESGVIEEGSLHLHATPAKGEKVPHHVVVRLRDGDTDVRGTVPLAK